MELFGFEIALESSEGENDPQAATGPAPTRTAPDAPMHLLLRFETANGPRTVIASSVSRQVAVDIRDAMAKAGQHAEFIDRIEPLSVADRVMISRLH